jgi:putative ABC transport system substrate-binding protein
MASFVARILSGANPATLPVEQPREFQFVVNRGTANALGLKIPKSLEFQMTEPFL